MNNLDVVICVGVKDIFIVKKTVRYVNQYIKPEKTYFVLNRRFFKFFSKAFLAEHRVTLLDENELVPGMNIHVVQQLVTAHFPQGMRGGWYFQQFLKMGFAMSKWATDYYLVWDADTIPTSDLSFFSPDGKMLLAQKTEYHRAYFDTMQRLIGLDKSVDFSFIAEHMIFKTSFMRELIDRISSSQYMGGQEKWYEAIIAATDPKERNGFSEFETYGTFVHTFHRANIEYRTLHTMRRAGLIFGRCIKDYEIKEFDGVTDTISLEAGHIPHFPRNIVQYAQLALFKLLKP